LRQKKKKPGCVSSDSDTSDFKIIDFFSLSNIPGAENKILAN
jgi:hypothetical protein